METCGNLFAWKGKHKSVAEPAATLADAVRAAPRPSALRACSACAGDYEDPDRTAWTSHDPEASEFDDASDANTEEFPAEQ